MTHQNVSKWWTSEKVKLKKKQKTKQNKKKLIKNFKTKLVTLKRLNSGLRLCELSFVKACENFEGV